MKEIPLTNSELFALVDDEDYEIVSEHDWHFNKGYAETRIYRNTISLHRFVLGLKRGDGIYVDHINDDGLHNYKSNLRKCTMKYLSKWYCWLYYIVSYVIMWFVIRNDMATNPEVEKTMSFYLFIFAFSPISLPTGLVLLVLYTLLTM